MPEEAQNNELEKYKKLAEEYLNGWKRAKADLINYQKEEVRRFEEVVKFANESVVRDFIVVLDSFDLAIATLVKQGAVEKGIYMIRTQLEDVLKKNGLERMVVAVGQKFDPALHEAVEEVASQQAAGTVVEEAGRGYMLYGRVVRAARVKISKSH